MIGGTETRHSESIYYAICDKQPVGSISIQTINELNNQRLKGNKYE